MTKIPVLQPKDLKGGGMIVFKGGIIRCSVCGVASNLQPDYQVGQGTAVPQRLSYCGHLIEPDYGGRQVWEEVRTLISGEGQIQIRKVEEGE